MTFETFDLSDKKTRSDQKKTMTKTKTTTKTKTRKLTKTKTNTFGEHLKRAIPGTFDI